MTTQGSEFLKQSIKTSKLQWAGGATDPQKCPAFEAVERFVTPEFLAEMKSAAACAHLSN
ncbi:hypothetical protein L210DRAFT_985939 [Boletus edulis BED1]|uniref:Uncharacterized protein n=1 Tax=Boletus edulis BED1 TaxID=1328754 RepID=A0AAD4GCG0_BOLED|nr:hypothetical protein L210DRAFT_985939 [Boletus edulis BED1]